MSEPIDKDLPDEQQLDDYMKGGSNVSQQYRQLHHAEVPADLDRLVLNQAHDAVKSTRPAKSRTWMRWTAPLALAASAVLVVSIVIESGVRDGEVLMSAPASAPAQVAAPMEAKREAADSDAAGNAAIEMRMPEPAPAAARANRAPQVAPPKAEVVVQDKAYSPPQLPSAEFANEIPVPPPAAPSLAEPDRSRSIKSDAPAVANDAQPSVSRAVDVSAFKEAEQAIARQGVTSTAIQQSAAVPAAAPAREVAADAVAEEEKSQALQQYSDPELWLRDIRQLRRENQKEQADKEWRRFRVQFPDYVIDEGDTAREVK
jgi:hypothetical protein